MAPPDPGDPGNPFQSLLGDLMNMLGSNGPDSWEMTRSFALNVATGGTPESNVEPLQRIQVEQLSRVAELNVIEATGMPVDARRPSVDLRTGGPRRLDGAGPRVLAVRATAMTPAAPGAPAPAPPGGTDDGSTPRRPDRRHGRHARPVGPAIGPMFFGLQVGSVVGHLSQRTLGQYPLAVPWAPSDELLLVTSNIAEFAADWSLPEEEALLWVCARELATNSVLTRPARAQPARGAAPRLASPRPPPSRTSPAGCGVTCGDDPTATGAAWTSRPCRGCSATPKHCWATC